MLTRRDFVKKTVGTTFVFSIVPAHIIGQSNRPAPSNRLTMGMIGLGSMGMRHTKAFLQESDCQILAVCDVDTSRRQNAVEIINQHYGNNDCAGYNDFRELINRKDIDTLCISVPDHWHSIISIESIRTGKDIYGEKPLALTISEGRAIVKEVEKYDCIWQTGSWQRSERGFRFACELVRNGRIGKLHQVEVGLANGYSTGLEPVMKVPEGFDYEMWIGPAPWAPFTSKRCHHYKFPHGFRWIFDYSGGQLTDCGAHHIDIAHWGMNCDNTGPIDVEGKGTFPEEGLWNTAIEYKLKCTYANGVIMHIGSEKYYKPGICFIGDQGWIYVNRGERLETYPKYLKKEKFGPNEIHLPRPADSSRQGHRRDFLDSVKYRKKTLTPAEIGHRSITVAHLGNIVMLLGRKIQWDPKAEQIIGDKSANRMLSRPMRAPWYL